MKQVLAVTEFENPQIKSMDENIAEYKQYETMKKEIENRMKSLKNHIHDQVEEKGDYINDKYSVVLKSYESKRLDTHRVKQLLIKNNVLEKYEKVTTSEKLTINVKK